MARAGDELVNPITGLRTVFRKTARQTSGELGEPKEKGHRDDTGDSRDP
jgi:hypothetical protein